MIGFDQADIRRIKAQESRNRGLSFLNDLIEVPTAGQTGEGSGTGEEPEPAGAGETA
jgi:hypothetical protein